MTRKSLSILDDFEGSLRTLLLLLTMVLMMMIGLIIRKLIN